MSAKVITPKYPIFDDIEIPDTIIENWQTTVDLMTKIANMDKQKSRKYGGIGLGLAITKQLVELHGGKIWAQSKYGEGTTFIFTLPLKSYTNKGKDRRENNDKSTCS